MIMQKRVWAWLKPCLPNGPALGPALASALGRGLLVVFLVNPWGSRGSESMWALVHDPAQMALAQAAQSPAEFEVEVSSATIREGTSFQVTVTFRGLDSDLFTGLGLPDSFEILGQSSSSSFQLVNGKASRSSALIFDVLARREGTYLLGPLSLKQGEREVRSNSVRLQVTRRSQSGGTGRAPGPHSQQTKHDAGPDDGPQMKVRLSAERVYVGQPVTLSIELRHRDGQAQVSYRDLQFPRLEGLSALDLGKPEQASAIENGLRYLTVRVTKKLTAIRDGIFDLHTIRVTADVLTPVQRSEGRGLFESMMPQFARSTEVLTPPVADSLRLTVLPLPKDGKPEGFSGLVGVSDVSFHYDGEQTPNLSVGGSLNLTVKVRSTGELEGIRLERPKVSSALKVYEDAAPAHQAPQTPSSGAPGQTVKEFRFAIVAVQPGTGTIAPYQLSYFDPVQARYVTVEHRFSPITVVAGSNGSGDGLSRSSDGAGATRLSQDFDQAADNSWGLTGAGVGVQRDLMPVKSGGEVFEQEDPTSQTVLIALLGPLAGLFAWLLALLLRGALDQVPVLRMIRYRRGALARARRVLRTLRAAPYSRTVFEQAQSVLSCVRDYLTARAGLSAAQMTVRELEQHFAHLFSEADKKLSLSQNDVPEIAPLWQALSTLESLAYSGESVGEKQMHDIVVAVEQGLLALDRKL